LLSSIRKLTLSEKKEYVVVPNNIDITITSVKSFKQEKDKTQIIKQSTNVINSHEDCIIVVTKKANKRQDNPKGEHNAIKI
jgi:UDP-N-acetylenolpyruvoylglucosamine reductase